MVVSLEKPQVPPVIWSNPNIDWFQVSISPKHQEFGICLMSPIVIFPSQFKIKTGLAAPLNTTSIGYSLVNSTGFPVLYNYPYLVYG